MSYEAFLLRTVYFSPLTNTLYPLLGVILAIFAVSSDLTKHSVLLALYAAGLTGYVTGPFLCVTDSANTARINPFITLLPMRMGDILKKTLLSCIFYSAIISAVLIGFMALELRLPFVQDAGVDFMETPGGARLPVATGLVWDVDGKTSIPYREVLDPSLIFGTVVSTAGFPVFAAWPILLFLFFTAMIGYLSAAVVFRPFIRKERRLLIAHGFLLCLYAVFGIVIAADLLVDPEIIWRWRLVLDAHSFILPLITAVGVLFFTGGMALLCRQSAKQFPE